MGTRENDAEIWLRENNAVYMALPAYHVQKPHYLSTEEMEKKTTLPTRNEAIDDYLENNISAIASQLFEKKPLGLQTVAIVKMPSAEYYIQGKDIFAAINGQIYNSHGINDNMITTDVTQEAYNFLESSIKKVVTSFIEDFHIQTQNYMMCHFSAHAMGMEEMQDFLMQQAAKKTAEQNSPD